MHTHPRLFLINKTIVTELLLYFSNPSVSVSIATLFHNSIWNILLILLVIQVVKLWKTTKTRCIINNTCTHPIRPHTQYFVRRFCDGVTKCKLRIYALDLKYNEKQLNIRGLWPYHSSEMVTESNVWKK